MYSMQDIEKEELGAISQHDEDGFIFSIPQDNYLPI